MEVEKLFGRKVLEAYLAITVVILTVVTYLLLAGVGFQQDSGFGMLSILLVILIAVNILHSIIELRVLDSVKNSGV